MTLMWSIIINYNQHSSHQLVSIRTNFTRFFLTHWGWALVKEVVIGSYNGLLPVQHQAIIWTNAGLLLIVFFDNKFHWNWNQFSHDKMNMKTSPAKWKQVCFGFNEFHKVCFILAQSVRKSLPQNSAVLTWHLENLVLFGQGPFSLTWINFNPRMDK